MAKGQKYHAGLTKWKKWKRRIVYQIHFGYLNKAALEHDNGAEPGSSISRTENDRNFLKNMIFAALDAPFILCPYLIFISFCFYGIVRLNPSHYQGRRNV